MEERTPKLNEGETIDRLGFQGLRIIQDPSKFKFTMDAFLLAGFIDPKPDHKILDLGSGGGVLSLLIAGQKQVASVSGLEIQPELVEMSRRSVELNKLGEKVSLELGDLKVLPLSLKQNAFDYVVTNPPFYPMTKGMVPANSYIALAKFEVTCTLEDIVRAASRLVRANGKVAMIYPTERLNDLILTLHHFHLTPKKVCFVHPKPAMKSNLVLIEARPGSGSGAEVLPAIFVYNEVGEYTEMMELIFHGESYHKMFP